MLALHTNVATNRYAILAALVAIVLVASSAPFAQAGNKPCVREAKQDKKDCFADCKEAFQTAKDACLNRDHDCVEVCRANRSQCRLDTGFDAAIDGCNALLESRRADCRNTTDPDTPARDQCIDAAQIEAFQCRDAARELAKPLLKQCRKDFRSCAQACPPVSSPAPADPKQCVNDANGVRTACLADCVETFQQNKDDCRNRDHDCVEQCRADRTTCRQPVRDSLAAALATCADIRQHGIHNQPDTPDQDGIDDCNARYPEPRDEAAAVAYDLCVDAVQVNAFICRDNAKEAARPGFENCRMQFRSCVDTNCPPLQ